MSKLILAGLLVVVIAQPIVAQGPQVEVTSQSIASGEVEALPTLDGTRVYRFTIDLDSQKLVPGASIDYEVRTAAGAATGGGMFTVSKDMINAEGKVSVLTGFGGLELSPEDVILVKLIDFEPETSSCSQTCGDDSHCAVSCNPPRCAHCSCPASCYCD